MNINGHPLLNDVTVKQRIITTILTGMDNHKTDSMIVYYGCLSLSKMRIDQDVVSSSTRSAVRQNVRTLKCPVRYRESV